MKEPDILLRALELEDLDFLYQIEMMIGFGNWVFPMFHTRVGCCSTISLVLRQTFM